MTNEEKLNFILTILKIEAENYMKAPIYYEGDMQVEYWLDTMISKVNPEARIKGSLESAYKAALKLYERRKDDYDQLFDFMSKR